ncbi:MAG: hypothetical protein LBK12_01330 [Odoribacteraceae bacterium]|jgi:hypothetical protein|nr:hypothetical protein [Odoribacteraceae bacterium]
MRIKTHLWILLLLLAAPVARAQRVQFDRDRLPQPVFHPYPGLVDFYWEAWQQAWTRAKAPSEETARAGDDALAALVYKYAPRLFPAAETLDKFYLPVPGESESSPRAGFLDGPPLLAWIESEYYRFTGDEARLQALLRDKKLLQRYFEYFNRAGDVDAPPGGQREQADPSRANLTSRQALAALYISQLAEVINYREAAKEFRNHYQGLKAILNKHYWDEAAGTYFVPRPGDPDRVLVKRPAAYRVMLAEVPSAKQARRMADLARDTSVFGGLIPWPSASRDDPGFDANDGLPGRGAVCLPLAYVGIKALERYGFLEEADEMAYNLLLHQYATFMNHEPRALWEYYNPSRPEPGKDARPDPRSGSALGPISLFIENVLGFHRVDAQNRIVEWRKYHRGLHGIKNFSFGDVTADIIGDDHVIQVETNEPFTLIVNGKSYRVRKGSNTLR